MLATAVLIHEGHMKTVEKSREGVGTRELKMQNV